MKQFNLASSASALFLSAFPAAGATMSFDFKPPAGPIAASGVGSGPGHSESRAKHLTGDAGFVLTSCGSPAYGLISKEIGCDFEETLAAANGSPMVPSHFEDFASVGLALESGKSFSIDTIFAGDLTRSEAALFVPVPQGSVPQAVEGWVGVSFRNRFNFSETSTMPDIAVPGMEHGEDAFSANLDERMALGISKPGTSGLLLLAVLPFVFSFYLGPDR